MVDGGSYLGDDDEGTEEVGREGEGVEGFGVVAGDEKIRGEEWKPMGEWNEGERKGERKWIDEGCSDIHSCNSSHGHPPPGRLRICEDMGSRRGESRVGAFSRHCSGCWVSDGSGRVLGKYHIGR